ncbi:MAG: hypothetical protein FWD04_06380 [Conexibacteraceae bacterium]|nr:hypothetical protein [Conexibacteraceae bacterium]
MHTQNLTEPIPWIDNPALYEQFTALTSNLDEYDHLPELTLGTLDPTRPLEGQIQQDTIDESILAWLTLP